MSKLVDDFWKVYGCSEGLSRFLWSGMGELNQTLASRNSSMSVVGIRGEKSNGASITQENIIPFLKTLLPSGGIPFNELRIQYFEIGLEEDQNVLGPIYFALSNFSELELLMFNAEQLAQFGSVMK